MSDQVIFDPAGMDSYSRASADALEELALRHRSQREAIARVLATGDPTNWSAKLPSTPFLVYSRDELRRLAAFTTWLADRARALDDAGRSCAALDVDRLGPLPAHALLRPADRQLWATRLAKDLTDGSHLVSDAREWTMVSLLADDPEFARQLVAMLGGPAAVADVLLGQHDLRAPGDGPLDGGRPGTESGNGTPELTRLVGILGTSLGTLTQSPAWTDRDTAQLARLLQASHGDRDFAPRRAEALAVLVAAADRVAPPVVTRLIDVAVEVERTDGPTAWAARATGPGDGQPWPRPVLDHTGHPADDVTSTLLLALHSRPEAALAALASGPTVPGPGARPAVDATLAHLLRDHDFDDVGWERLGTALESAVLPHRGRDATGQGAARLSGQALALVAERIERTGALPRPFQPGVAAVFADAMPAVVPALDGTDPADWVADTPDPWTFVDAGIHPTGLPVQPAVVGDDAAAIVDRLGSNPDEMVGILAASVGTIDLAVTRSRQQGRTLTPLREDVARSAGATGRILSGAFDGVSTDHRAAERTRGRVQGVGTLVGTTPLPGAGVVGGLVELAGGAIIDEPALPGDYDGTKQDLADAVEHRLMDGLLIDGWFDDVSESMVVRDESGTVVGFDHSSGDLATWRGDLDLHLADVINDASSQFAEKVDFLPPPD